MIDTTSTTSISECTTCHAPLAADQRYCVYCGTRAPTVRLEFLDTLRADAVTPPRRTAVTERAGVNAASILAVIAALGIGALLGHWATSVPQPAPTTTPATQVIRVTGDTPAPATGEPAPTATAAPSSTPTATPTAEATATPAKDDPGTTKDLSKDSIKKAVKKKAPISTGGTPPPVDHKAPGGGSDFETIG